MRVGRLAALLLAGVGVFVAGGCATDRGDRHPELVVGSKPDSESTLLAAIYVAALRSYGFGARGETGADPMAMLDSGGFTVVPGFTGKVLQILQPRAAVLSAARVYRAMVSALPEGIAAGDYTTAAEDKPTLVVTPDTAKAWSGSDLSLVLSHCNELVEIGRAHV